MSVKLWRHRRREMWLKKYSSAPPGWRMIPGFQQGASWFKVRWRAEMRRFEKKWLLGASPAKRRCVIVFNEQSGKGIFRKTLTLQIWLVMYGLRLGNVRVIR